VLISVHHEPKTDQKANEAKPRCATLKFEPWEYKSLMSCDFTFFLPKMGAKNPVIEKTLFSLAHHS
jgi:hypothetical protein